MISKLIPARPLSRSYFLRAATRWFLCVVSWGEPHGDAHAGELAGRGCHIVRFNGKGGISLLLRPSSTVCA